MTRTIIAATVSLVLLVVAGCDNDAPEERAVEKEPYVPRLPAIVENAIIMQISLSGNLQMYCTLEDMTSKMPAGEGELHMKFVKEQKERFNKECSFWRSIDPVIKPLFEKIQQEKAVPSPVYFFTAFDSSDGEPSSMDVGLFTSLKTCQKFETEYKDFGGGTGKCREWKDVLKNMQPQKPPIAN